MDIIPQHLAAKTSNCHPSQINTLEARRAELTGTLKELRREDALAAAVIWRLEKTAVARSYMKEQRRTVLQRTAMNRQYETER